MPDVFRKMLVNSSIIGQSGFALYRTWFPTDFFTRTPASATLRINCSWTQINFQSTNQILKLVFWNMLFQVFNQVVLSWLAEYEAINHCGGAG
jgi:hypothetical protein